MTVRDCMEFLRVSQPRHTLLLNVEATKSRKNIHMILLCDIMPVMYISWGYPNPLRTSTLVLAYNTRLSIHFLTRPDPPPFRTLHDTDTIRVKQHIFISISACAGIIRDRNQKSYTVDTCTI